jgi:hypothetical protein
VRAPFDRRAREPEKFGAVRKAQQLVSGRVRNDGRWPLGDALDAIPSGLDELSVAVGAVRYQPMPDRSPLVATKELVSCA